MKKQSSLHKKLTKALLSLTFVLPLLGPVSQPSLAFAQTPSTISVIIDGDLQSYDQPPVLINNRVMVPVRSIFEALGATVDWDPVRKAVKATKNGVEIEASLTNDSIFVDGYMIHADQPPVMRNDRVLVPLRMISEILGTEVTWDGAHQTVQIKSTAAMKLSDALYSQDLGQIETLLQSGVDPSDYVLGRHALEYTFAHGKWEAAKLLLKHDVDKEGNFLFGLTTYLPKIESVKFCLQHANLTTRPTLTEHILINSVSSSQIELVKAALATKADPNADQALKSMLANETYTRPHFGPMTPLGDAIYSHDYDLALIELLLEAGADPNRITLPERSTFSPLHKATEDNMIALLQLLVRYEANVNAQDEQGWTPLMIAADRGNADAVQALLKAKADPNVSNNAGATALMIAEAHGNTETAQILEAAGAVRNKNRPVLQALFYDYDNLMRNVNETWTPLMRATLLGNTAQIKTLLAEGVDPKQPGKPNAFEIAIGSDNIETIRAFYEAKKPLSTDQINDALQQAVSKKNPDLARLALEHGADPNHVDEFSTSMLAQATSQNDTEMIQLLLRYGAKGAAHDNMNPMLEAVMNGNLRAVDLLIADHSNDAEKTHALGEALIFALYVENMSLVQHLLELGADPNYLYEGLRTTPLQAAKETHFPEFVTVLKEAGAKE